MFQNPRQRIRRAPPWTSMTAFVIWTVLVFNIVDPAEGRLWLRMTIICVLLIVGGTLANAIGSEKVRVGDAAHPSKHEVAGRRSARASSSGLKSSELILRKLLRRIRTAPPWMSPVALLIWCVVALNIVDLVEEPEWLHATLLCALLIVAVILMNQIGCERDDSRRRG
jgi:uncharacterized membrane protein